jgi:hypothetical protein
MWSSGLVPLAAVLGFGVLAWRHATRVDRRAQHQSWPQPSEPNGASGLALGALVAAVAAATVLQLMFLPYVVQ